MPQLDILKGFVVRPTKALNHQRFCLSSLILLTSACKEKRTSQTATRHSHAAVFWTSCIILCPVLTLIEWHLSTILCKGRIRPYTDFECTRLFWVRKLFSTVYRLSYIVGYNKLTYSVDVAENHSCRGLMRKSWKCEQVLIVRNVIHFVKRPHDKTTIDRLIFAHCE